MSRTIARTYRNIIRELELPRTVLVSGEFPNAEYKTFEDNEENRKKDFDYLAGHYKDCNVYQQDENGKLLRENKVNVEAIENHLTACGF